MIRGEEIKQAAEAYASQMCNLCLDEYCLKMGLTCPNIHESVIAFTDGSEWADEHSNLESLWHDAGEEPRYEEFLLAEESDEFNIYKLSGQEDNNSWELLVSTMGIIRWAYIDDLLPKQFGNSEQLKGGEK